MSVKLEGIKLALTVLGLVLSVLTLACSLAYAIGGIGTRVEAIDGRLVRIEKMIDSGWCGECRVSAR